MLRKTMHADFKDRIASFWLNTFKRCREDDTVEITVVIGGRCFQDAVRKGEEVV